MHVFVIDDTGKVWMADQPEYREAFYLTGIKGDISPHLVDKMGFVCLGLRDGTTLVVRFNPETITKPALSSLYTWLRANSYGRLCLAYGSASGSLLHKIVGQATAGLRELEAIIAEARGPDLPFTSMPEPLDNIRDIPALGPIFDLWRARSGAFTEADYQPLLSGLARDRFSILAPNPSDGAIEIVHAGKGLQIPDKQAHADLKGARLERVAGAFGQWASVMYHDVLERQHPRLDHIYALIPWPRVGEVERRYSRMILPCHAKGGRQLLLGVNCDRAFGLCDLDGEAA
jgi:hypothetical protein